MTTAPIHDPPVETFEHRLGASDLEALARLVGLTVAHVAADHLDLRVGEDLVGARSLAFPLSGRQTEFVNVTSDWIQLAHDDIHLFRCTVTDAPWDIPVGKPNAHGARAAGPCSWLRCEGFGPIRSVEIVSYEFEDDVIEADGLSLGREAVLYDRALRLRFGTDRVLTLSTHHRSILGEIEVRRSDDIGATDPSARVVTRHTLN